MKLKNKTNSFTSFFYSSIKEIIYKQMRIYREILGGIIVNTFCWSSEKQK